MSETIEAVTLVGLRDLHERVQERFRTALGQHAGRYEALGQRYDCVHYRKLKAEVQELGADLRALLAASDERLRYVARRGSTSVDAPDPAGMSAYAALQSQYTGTRPKTTATELLLRFKDRGFVMIADGEGNLRVSPASALSDGDRAVLIDYKPGLLAALSRNEAIL